MGTGLSRLVFQPPRPSYTDDPNLVWLTTRRGNRIPAFHVYRSSSALTVLFSHGNAEDIGMVVNYFKELAPVWDVNIFAYEYSGYGCSSGTPSEANVYADIEAAYDYLTSQCRVDPKKIVLYGRSLGTGACVHLASGRLGLAGVILQSPLLSVHRIGINLRVTLPGDMFRNIDKIGKVKCPVFIIHGVRDTVVPFSHGVALYNACATAVTPYWIADAGHNNVEAAGREEFVLNMGRFFKFLRTLESKDAEAQWDTTCKTVDQEPPKLWTMPGTKGLLA